MCTAEKSPEAPELIGFVQRTQQSRFTKSRPRHLPAPNAYIVESLALGHAISLGPLNMCPPLASPWQDWRAKSTPSCEKSTAWLQQPIDLHVVHNDPQLYLANSYLSTKKGSPGDYHFSASTYWPSFPTTKVRFALVEFACVINKWYFSLDPTKGFIATYRLQTP